MDIAFVKGHGTQNDFVVLPDLDGSLHDALDADLVRRLCHRRGGIGADGVLRVLDRSGVAAVREQFPVHEDDVDPAWFMDYRNADGSVAEMCGNGVRVFVAYLVDAGLVHQDGSEQPLAIGTRGGVKYVTFCADGELSVDMGVPDIHGMVEVTVDGRAHDALHVSMPNPHAVVLVDSLAEAGSLHESPGYDSADYPDGVNVEFVVRERRGAPEPSRAPMRVGAADLRDDISALVDALDVQQPAGAVPAPQPFVHGDESGSIAMRVFERGSGETESCGTGACAAVVAAHVLAGWAEHKPATYRVDVPGGTLTATWDADDHVHLKGPAVLVAAGTWLAESADSDAFVGA